MSRSLSEVAAVVNGIIVGDANLSISTLSPFDNIAHGSLVFANDNDKIKLVENSLAHAILVSNNIESSCKSLIKVNDPYHDFVTLLQYFYQFLHYYE